MLWRHASIPTRPNSRRVSICCTYYSRIRRASVTAESVRPLRRKHILWMIENHPEHPTMGEMPGIIDQSDTPLADPEGWAQADLVWKRATAAAPRAEGWANAIAFYRTTDPAFALDLAERGRAAFRTITP